MATVVGRRPSTGGSTCSRRNRPHRTSRAGQTQPCLDDYTRKGVTARTTPSRGVSEGGPPTACFSEWLPTALVIGTALRTPAAGTPRARRAMGQAGISLCHQLRIQARREHRITSTMSVDRLNRRVEILSGHGQLYALTDERQQLRTARRPFSCPSLASQGAQSREMRRRALSATTPRAPSARGPMRGQRSPPARLTAAIGGPAHLSGRPRCVIGQPSLVNPGPHGGRSHTNDASGRAQRGDPRSHGIRLSPHERGKDSNHAQGRPRSGLQTRAAPSCSPASLRAVNDGRCAAGSDRAAALIFLPLKPSAAYGRPPCAQVLSRHILASLAALGRSGIPRHLHSGLPP